jgi:hypothetical protein
MRPAPGVEDTMNLRGIAIAAGALVLGSITLAPSAIKATNAAESIQRKDDPRDLTGTWQLDASRGNAPRAGNTRPILPVIIRITASDVGILLSDSTGTIIRDISFAAVDSSAEKKEPPRVSGKWQNGRLEARFTGPKGSVVWETFVLDKTGTELVVHTRTKRKGGGELVSRRIYVKVRPS